MVAHTVRQKKYRTGLIAYPVRDKLRSYTSVNALVNAITKMNIVAVRPLGAIKSNNNLWAYAAEIEFSVTYTEGYTI